MKQKIFRITFIIILLSNLFIGSLFSVKAETGSTLTADSQCATPTNTAKIIERITLYNKFIADVLKLNKCPLGQEISIFGVSIRPDFDFGGLLNQYADDFGDFMTSVSDFDTNYQELLYNFNFNKSDLLTKDVEAYNTQLSKLRDSLFEISGYCGSKPNNIDNKKIIEIEPRYKQFLTDADYSSASNLKTNAQLHYLAFRYFYLLLMKANVPTNAFTDTLTSKIEYLNNQSLMDGVTSIYNHLLNIPESTPSELDLSIALTEIASQKQQEQKNKDFANEPFNPFSQEVYMDGKKVCTAQFDLAKMGQEMFAEVATNNKILSSLINIRDATIELSKEFSKLGENIQSAYQAVATKNIKLENIIKIDPNQIEQLGQAATKIQKDFLKESKGIINTILQKDPYTLQDLQNMIKKPEDANPASPTYYVDFGTYIKQMDAATVSINKNIKTFNDKALTIDIDYLEPKDGIHNILQSVIDQIK